MDINNVSRPTVPEACDATTTPTDVTIENAAASSSSGRPQNAVVSSWAGRTWTAISTHVTMDRVAELTLLGGLFLGGFVVANADTLADRLEGIAIAVSAASFVSFVWALGCAATGNHSKAAKRLVAAGVLGAVSYGMFQAARTVAQATLHKNGEDLAIDLTSSGSSSGEDHSLEVPERLETECGDLSPKAGLSTDPNSPIVTPEIDPADCVRQPTDVVDPSVDDSKVGPSATPHYYEINFHPSRPLTPEDQAQLRFALAKSSFIKVEADPTTGIEKITLLDKSLKPAGEKGVNPATFLEVMRQMVIANPQSKDFAGLGEKVAKWVIMPKSGNPDAALQPAAMELLKASLTIETGIHPGWLEKYPDFMIWAMENGIAQKALANGHKWKIGQGGVPVLATPSGRTNWLLLKKQGIVDEQGHMAKDVEYTAVGFVQVSAPIGTETADPKDESLFDEHFDLFST